MVPRLCRATPRPTPDAYSFTVWPVGRRLRGAPSVGGRSRRTTHDLPIPRGRRPRQRTTPSKKRKQFDVDTSGLPSPLSPPHSRVQLVHLVSKWPPIIWSPRKCAKRTPNGLGNPPDVYPCWACRVMRFVKGLHMYAAKAVSHHWAMPPIAALPSG